MKKLQRFGIKTIDFLAVLLFGIFGIISLFGAVMTEDAYHIEQSFVWHNPLLSILWVVLLALVLVGLNVLFGRMGNGERVLLILSSLWIFGVVLLWAFLTKNGPNADGASVYYAAKKFARGDFSSLSYRDSYFSCYPFQLGLAFFYSIFLRLLRNDSFHILQVVNAFCMVICLLMQFELCKEFMRGQDQQKRRKVQRYCMLLLDVSAPFLIFGSFLYGEVPSFAFLLTATVLFIRMLRKNSIIATIFGFISLVLAVMVRLNTYIFLVALAIILILFFMVQGGKYSSRKKVLFFCYFLGVILASVRVVPAIEDAYGRRSYTEINDGVPTGCYLAMGIMDSEVGPGWYNGYNFETFTIDADYDSKKAQAIGMMKYRILSRELWQNPVQALGFYGRKVVYEWINCGWSVYSGTFISFGERHPLVDKLFEKGPYKAISRYMNTYQSLLYLLVAVGAFGLWRRKEEDGYSAFTRIFLLTAFGGFLFYLAWEAGGRYVLPYAFFVLPNAAMGLESIEDFISKKRETKV